VPSTNDLVRSSWSFEAPAIHHKELSFATVWSSIWMLGRAPSNTQELRCFQTSQATSMMREFKPIRISFGTDRMVLHHQAEKLEDSAVGKPMTRFRYWKMKNQI